MVIEIANREGTMDIYERGYIDGIQAAQRARRGITQVFLDGFNPRESTYDRGFVAGYKAGRRERAVR
jgi:hypothetical protein